MSKRQRQVIALLLGTLIAAVVLNAVLLAGYTLLVIHRPQQTTEQPDICGLSKAEYSNGYTVYRDCTGKTVAYTVLESGN